MCDRQTPDRGLTAAVYRLSMHDASAHGKESGRHLRFRAPQAAWCCGRATQLHSECSALAQFAGGGPGSGDLGAPGYRGLHVRVHRPLSGVPFGTLVNCWAEPGEGNAVTREVAGYEGRPLSGLAGWWRRRRSRVASLSFLGSLDFVVSLAAAGVDHAASCSQ